MNITITDDQRIEDNEQFNIMLNTTDLFVRIDIAFATVTVTDNEGIAVVSIPPLSWIQSLYYLLLIRTWEHGNMGTVLRTGTTDNIASFPGFGMRLLVTIVARFIDCVD